MNWLLPTNAYTALISGLFMISLGIFVFFKSPTKKLNIIYLLFTASMANWLIFSFMLYNAKDDAQAVFWDRMVYLGVVFIPIFMYHFGLIFINKEKENKLILWAGYLMAVGFLFLSRTDYFVSGLWKYSWGLHAQAKIMHHLFLLFFFSYILAFLWQMYKYSKDVKEKNLVLSQQVRYLFISFVALNLGSYAFLAAYNINLNPLGAYVLEIISVSMMFFAITKYHLFETKV
ncbi:MAG: histidine kinase N-terminal 7TM domain-containing protein, partial [Candidatus Paceibacterota bacterium]